LEKLHFRLRVRIKSEANSERNPEIWSWE